MSKLLQVGLIILSIALIGIGLYSSSLLENFHFNFNQSDKKLATTTLATTTLSTTTTSTKSTITNTKTSIKKPIIPTIPAPTYAELIKKYNGWRLQFSANCQVTPGSFIIKKGSQFMIDNRDEIAHNFAFGATKYSIKPYGYAIVTASVVGTTYVLCDGIQRATITIAP
ncbi:MAG: hypothetical protein WCL61_01100 [bacterium]